MDRRFLTVLGVSLVFALVVASIFYQISARSGGPGEPVEDTQTRDLVVAVKPLGVGAMLKPEDVKVIQVPDSQFPTGGISKVEEAIDRPVISNILLDEPIHEGRLAPRGSGAGLAPVIPEGMRAVSLRVNEVVGVAGFVLPGMRVDILLTGSPASSGSRVTRTILQNILVLSAGQQLESNVEGQAMNVRVVTLLVSPGQAETLTLASNEGQVQLVLRNGSDTMIAKTEGAAEGELYGTRQAEAPRPVVRAVPVSAPPPPPPPPPNEIVVYRGAQRTVEVVNAAQERD